MKTTFEDYINYLKIPKWNKELKNLGNQIIQNWYKADYSESVNYEELKEFEVLEIVEQVFQMGRKSCIHLNGKYSQLLTMYKIHKGDFPKREITSFLLSLNYNRW